MPGKPGWRGEPSGGTPDAFPLVIDPKLPLLPLHELPWERFEELVLEIVQEEENPVEIRPYGLRGQNQHGIDVIARRASGDWHVFRSGGSKNSAWPTCGISPTRSSSARGPSTRDAS